MSRIRETIFVIRKLKNGKFRAEILSGNGAVLFKGKDVSRPNRALSAIRTARDTGLFTPIRQIG